MKKEEIVGRVRWGEEPPREVRWDPESREVYVHLEAWTRCGVASCAADALWVAEAYLFEHTK